MDEDYFRILWAEPDEFYLIQLLPLEMLNLCDSIASSVYVTLYVRALNWNLERILERIDSGLHGLHFSA